MQHNAFKVGGTKRNAFKAAREVTKTVFFDRWVKKVTLHGTVTVVVDHNILVVTLVLHGRDTQSLCSHSNKHIITTGYIQTLLACKFVDLFICTFVSMRVVYNTP